MNLRILGRFLFGDARAIREVAANRNAFWLGIALVLLTGIARNYDQHYFLETPRALIGPLIFSFFSGCFLYGILVRGFARRHFPEGLRKEKQWRTFMTLFWMTAPIAWLYAIPVERLLDSYPAAQANIALLSLVSLWRVLLMGRILSVLFEMAFLRAFTWVLVAASLEVIIIVTLGPFFSGAFGRSILAGMAGMRNAPEENLLTSVLGFAWLWSWVVLIVCVLALAARRFHGVLSPLPKSFPGKVSWAQFAGLAILWTALAIKPQIEQHRFTVHASLVEKGQYVEALRYLTNYNRSDFPPSRRLEPNPYEYRVWGGLPPTIAAITSNTPPWIRNTYLNHWTATLSHYHSRYDSLTNIVAMFSALEQLPEGRDWLLTNQLALVRQGLNSRHGRGEPSEPESAARTEILETLNRMGMAETNLATLAE